VLASRGIQDIDKLSTARQSGARIRFFVWRLFDTRYEITVSNPERICSGVMTATMDDSPVDAKAIPLTNDGRVHFRANRSRKGIVGQRWIGGVGGDLASVVQGFSPSGAWTASRG